MYSYLCIVNFICIYFNRLIINAKLIILLVDQNISNRTITKCIDIAENTSTSIIIITFGYHQTETDRTIESYVVTDLTSAVKAVMTYYK